MVSESQLDTLPPVLTYSPIALPTPSSTSPADSSTTNSKHLHTTGITLPRRDLFDARYQLLSEDRALESHSGGSGRERHGAAKEGKDGIEFFENPSDLLPGVYEGGLKTWECALTLVEALEQVRYEGEGAERIRGKRVFEVKHFNFIIPIGNLNQQS